MRQAARKRRQAPKEHTEGDDALTAPAVGQQAEGHRRQRQHHQQVSLKRAELRVGHV
jgi:hypothetical protein